MQATVFQTITTGVYVLTSRHQGRINGTTVAWVTPVAYDPLLILVSMAGVRVSHDLVKQSGYFGLNVLNSDQIDLTRHYGFKTAREVNKLQDQSYKLSNLGLPVLEGVKAFIECRLRGTYPAGEHTLFVGEVVSAEILNESARPLIFKQEDYF